MINQPERLRKLAREMEVMSLAALDMTTPDATEGIDETRHFRVEVIKDGEGAYVLIYDRYNTPWAITQIVRYPATQLLLASEGMSAVAALALEREAAARIILLKRQIAQLDPQDE